jgi:hypothetical protein
LSRPLRIAAGAVLAAAIVACAAPARAEDAADVAAARDLFREGSSFAQGDDWEAARIAFAASLKRKRAAITLYGLAVAERSTRHLVDAREHFRAFLAEASTSATQPYEQPARNAIKELEQRLGRVVVRLDPEVVGARITVDGAEAADALSGGARLVDPGNHEITVAAAGYAPVTRSAAVQEGGAATLRFHLEREAAPGSHRALPITLLVGGGALLATGVALGIVGVVRGSTAPTRDGPDAREAKTMGLAGDVLGASGIGAAAAGVLLYVLGRPTARGTAREQISPWVSGSIGGLRVRF